MERRRPRLCETMIRETMIRETMIRETMIMERRRPRLRKFLACTNFSPGHPSSTFTRTPP
jgi:hypothetical protein